MKRMFYCSTAASEYIFKQNDDAACFFILESGSANVEINGEVKKSVKPGESFGELALLYNAPRSASIKANEECKMWAINRNLFRKLVETMNSSDFEENRKFLDLIPLFESLTSEQKNSITSVLSSQKFSPGQAIVSEGDPGSSYYIIKKGTVSVLKGKKELRQMTKGDAFGEQALYYNSLRTCSVKALDETICLALGRDVLTQIFGDSIQSITFRNIQRWAIEKSTFISKLSKFQAEKIMDSMKISNVKKKVAVFNKGSLQSRKMAIVIEGKLKSESGKVYSKGNLVGEELFSKGANELAKENIVAEEDSVLSELTFDKFQKLFNNTFLDELASQYQLLQQSMNTDEEQKLQNARQESTNLKLTDFKSLKPLGAGQFGSVFLVRNKVDDELYAMKCVAKKQVVELNIEKHIQQEKTVMDQTNFPFIMRYVRTFTDDFYVYFLLEFIQGMELFDAIREIGLLNTKETQFYIGSIILAIEYLHSRHIVYRDLKPENAMVDAKGFLLLIDLGTAKPLKSSKGFAAAKTYTIIGTPHYMAPEIISGKGYNYLVDLWTIGVVMYEFMGGLLPFGEELDDPYEIYEEIVKKGISYPHYMNDRKAKKMIEQLLNKVPEVRLGGSYTALKNHPWFSGFDWDKLMAKKLNPTYIPSGSKFLTTDQIARLDSHAKPFMQVVEEEVKKNKLKACKTTFDADWK